MNFSSSILIGGRTRFIYACQRKFASFSDKKLPIFLDKYDQVINVTSESEKSMKKLFSDDKVLKILPIENCHDFHDDQLSASIILGNIVNFYDINLNPTVLKRGKNRGFLFVSPTIKAIIKKWWGVLLYGHVGRQILNFLCSRAVGACDGYPHILAHQLKYYPN